MKRVALPMRGLAIIGIILGSFAGALLRALASLWNPLTSGSPVLRSLLLSTGGGALLGALLGGTLHRKTSDAWRAPVGIALIAAIGAYGAAAASELLEQEGAPWPFWRDAALNIAVTIVAARAVMRLTRGGLSG